MRPSLPQGIRLDENVYVAMRDGARLAIDVYRPETDDRYPALLSMSPYIKEIQQCPPALSHSIEAGATGFFVPKGYVHVIAQIRGTGRSQGQYGFFDLNEQQDGYDLVEWIARQPWCDGNVGMLGDSYFGMIQWLVAALQPPHLRCIAPYDAGTDVYRDFTHHGGIFNSWFAGFWGPDTLEQCVWPGPREPIQGKLSPANFLADWASHPEDGPYYWERSGWNKVQRIEVPVLSIVVQHGNLHTRAQLRSYPEIKSPKKLLVLALPGTQANELIIRSRPLNEYLLRWYDHWLKGIDTGLLDEPPIAVCDGATREWRYENEYPLARTRWTELYLRSNPAGPASKAPYGLMLSKPPEDDEPDSYAIPESLGLVASGQPVLAYVTPPLDEALRLWGPVSATIFASSTNLDTAWFAKLAEVAPDGTVTLLTYGYLKASFREVDSERSKPGQPFHPFMNPTPPEPNAVYQYEIEMRPIFHTVRAGYSLRLQIASDDFDYQGRLRTVYVSEMLPIPAQNTIYHDASHPSRVLLPVIPDAPAIKPVGPPISEISWPLLPGDQV